MSWSLEELSCPGGEASLITDQGRNRCGACGGSEGGGACLFSGAKEVKSCRAHSPFEMTGRVWGQLSVTAQAHYDCYPMSPRH